MKDRRAKELLCKEDFAAGIVRLHLPGVSKAKNSSGEGDKMG